MFVAKASRPTTSRGTDQRGLAAVRGDQEADRAMANSLFACGSGRAWLGGRAAVAIVAALTSPMVARAETPARQQSANEAPTAPAPAAETAAPQPENRPEPSAASTMGDLSLGELLDPKITTASRVVEKATEAPATVYVISKNDIRDRGYSVLSDVLKDLPGMETSEYYYSEQGTLVPVRGVVGNNKIVLLINGMRVNPPGGEELMIRSDVSVRFAEQIEIVYGPGSTLYGQDAISAVINIKTREPADQKAEALAAGGNVGAKEGFAAFSVQLREHTDAPISVTAYASIKTADLHNLRTSFPEWYKKYDDYLTAGGLSTEAVRGDFGLNVFGRVASRNASLQAWYRDSRRSSTEGSGEGGLNPVLWFVPAARWRDRSLVAEGQHLLELADSLSLSSILVFNRYEIDPESRYVFPNGMGGLFMQDFKYGIGTSASLEEKLDYELGENTHFTAGVVGSNYDVIPKVSVVGDTGADTTGDIVAQAGTLTYYRAANDPASKVEIRRAENLHYRNLGAYAEGSHRFPFNVRVLGGVRVDINTRFDETPISPRAAVIYSGLGDRLTLKYIFSMAYVAPAPYFGHNVFDNGAQISAPNPDLQPERLTANEINATWKSGGLLVAGSVFYNHQSNLLITAQSEAPETILEQSVFLNPDGTGPTRLVRHSINLGTSNALGVDLSSRYTVGPVSAWASYSFVDFSRTLGASKEVGLPQISQHNVRAGFTFARFGLAVTPSLVLRSTPQNLGATYDIPGVNMKTPYEVNLHARYGLPVKGLDAFATVRNLTNNHYAVRGVAGPAQQEPFSMMGGVHFRY
jgi:outer membrane receptor protein involved in Fe transport